MHLLCGVSSQAEVGRCLWELLIKTLAAHHYCFVQFLTWNLAEEEDNTGRSCQGNFYSPGCQTVGFTSYSKRWHLHWHGISHQAHQGTDTGCVGKRLVVLGMTKLQCCCRVPVNKWSTAVLSSRKTTEHLPTSAPACPCFHYLPRLLWDLEQSSGCSTSQQVMQLDGDRPGPVGHFKCFLCCSSAFSSSTA